MFIIKSAVSKVFQGIAALKTRIAKQKRYRELYAMNDMQTPEEMAEQVALYYELNNIVD